MTIYFRVPDINAAVDRIKSNGGTIVNGPIEVPGGDWVVKRDRFVGRRIRTAREEAQQTSNTETEKRGPPPAPACPTHEALVRGSFTGNFLNA